MKFQILTEPLDQMQAIATGGTHLATCLAPSWVCDHPIRILGTSEMDARGKVIQFLQQRLNEIQAKYNLIEVDFDLDPQVPHGTEFGG